MILFPLPADLSIFQAIFPISDYAGQIRPDLTYNLCMQL